MGIFDRFRDSFFSRNSAVNIVFCIDLTSSMKPFLKFLENNIKQIYDEFYRLNVFDGERANTIHDFKIRIVGFKDYELDDDPIIESEFFDVPFEMSKLKEFISKLEVSEKEYAKANGLEAFYYAMKSKWTIKNDRYDIQAIALFTDKDGYKLKEKKNCPDYPTDMVSKSTLVDMWNGDTFDTPISITSSRLVVFAPPDTIYQKIDLKNSSFNYVEKDKGLEELTVNYIVSELMIDHD